MGVRKLVCFLAQHRFTMFTQLSCSVACLHALLCLVCLHAELATFAWTERDLAWHLFRRLRLLELERLGNKLQCWCTQQASFRSLCLAQIGRTALGLRFAELSSVKRAELFYFVYLHCLICKRCLVCFVSFDLAVFYDSAWLACSITSLDQQ